MLKHYNITVKGRVQGVGFRYHTKIKAEELGIKGFVKNKPDRSVYVEAEAEEKIMDIFLKWCETGPVRSYVDSVNHLESPIQGFTGFEIR